MSISPLLTESGHQPDLHLNSTHSPRTVLRWAGTMNCPSPGQQPSPRENRIDKAEQRVRFLFEARRQSEVPSR